MIKVDSDILARFDTMLKIRQILPRLRPEYRKWLRYFLDFQAKYTPSEERSVQVRLFSEKLRSKGRTEAQVRQATDAVSLFFTSRQKMPFAASKAGPGAAPATALQGFPEQSHRVDDLPHASVVKEPAMVCTPPGPPVSDELGVRRKGQFDDWRCLRKTKYPAWDNIIAALADEIKARHYSRKTLQHYANWTRKYSVYLLHKDPAGLSPQDVKSYLTYLAVDCMVSSSTQNLAFNALLFLYRHVLKKDFGDQKDIPRAKKSTYVPTVLSRDEIQEVLARMGQPYQLIAKLQYGCGLRLMTSN